MIWLLAFVFLSSTLHIYAVIITLCVVVVVGSPILPPSSFLLPANKVGFQTISNQQNPQ